MRLMPPMMGEVGIHGVTPGIRGGGVADPVETEVEVVPGALVGGEALEVLMFFDVGEVRVI